ncbi:MAG: pyridoxamine 5'-phosphate oxidase family protein [Pseudothermotoga sp.]
MEYSFKPLRRKDRAIDEAEALKILSESEYGVLCTFDGFYPYGIPVNYVYEDGFIYIHSAKEGHKIECIKKLDRVCFVVVGDCQVIPQEFSTRYESVVVFGKARVLFGEQAAEPLRKIAKKYSSEYLQEAEKIIEESLQSVAVIEIQIEHIQGKARR